MLQYVLLKFVLQNICDIVKPCIWKKDDKNVFIRTNKQKTNKKNNKKKLTDFSKKFIKRNPLGQFLMLICLY